MGANRTRVLIVTAVESEQLAIERGIGGDPRFDVIAAGGGAVAAAVKTAVRLSAGDYGLVISAGIGGGFRERAGLESVVVGTEAVAADFGAETPDGFSSVEELGFGRSRFPADSGRSARFAEALQSAGIPAVMGPVITVNTATGSEATAAALRQRVPDAAAEAMEGFGVAAAAAEFGLPFMEVRAVSNLVGLRRRETWRIREALQQLEKASSILREVLT